MPLFENFAQYDLASVLSHQGSLEKKYSRVMLDTTALLTPIGAPLNFCGGEFGSQRCQGFRNILASAQSHGDRTAAQYPQTISM